MAFFKSPLDRRGWTGYRVECIFWSTRPDCGCLDLQERRGKKGLSDGPLDKCRVTSIRNDGVYFAEILLCVEEQTT